MNRVVSWFEGWLKRKPYYPGEVSEIPTKHLRRTYKQVARKQDAEMRKAKMFLPLEDGADRNSRVRLGEEAMLTYTTPGGEVYRVWFDGFETLSAFERELEQAFVSLREEMAMGLPDIGNAVE